jgi:hypothetical protein
MRSKVTTSGKNPVVTDGTIDDGRKSGVALVRERYEKVYEFVMDYVSRNGFQPNLDEIGSAFGVEKYKEARAHYWIRDFKNMGLIDGSLRGSRALRFLVTPDGKPFPGFRLNEEKP